MNLQFATTADLLRHYTEVRFRLTQLPFKLPWLTPKLTEIARWHDPHESWEPQERRITMESIIDGACAWLDVRHTEIISPRREQRVVYPRHIAMYLAREMTSLSLPAIGRKLGDRDHTTVMMATRNIGKRFAAGDAQLAGDIAMVRFLACAASRC